MCVGDSTGKTRRSGFNIVSNNLRRTTCALPPPPAFNLLEEEGSEHECEAEIRQQPLSSVAKDEASSSFYLLSDVDKVLSRCTDTEIRSFENLYTHQRLCKASKVPFSEAAQLVSNFTICDHFRLEKEPSEKSFYYQRKVSKRIHPW